MRHLPACVALSLGLLSLPAPAETPPHFAVRPGRVLNFGSVPVGKRVGRWIKLQNRGAGTVEVDWAPRPSPEFESSYSGTGVDAGRTFKFKFFFSPSDNGLFEVPLTFITSDPQRPEVTITLRGRGYFRR